jgi:hypothetical protein
VSLTCAFKKGKQDFAAIMVSFQRSLTYATAWPIQFNMVIAGGGQLTRRQHLLSRDGRQLLVCRANSIRVYSTATAELLFEMQGHLEEVTCLCLHPTNSIQVCKEIQILILQESCLLLKCINYIKIYQI